MGDPNDVDTLLGVFYIFDGPGALSQLHHVFEVLRASFSSVLAAPTAAIPVAAMMQSLDKNKATLHLHHLERRFLLIELRNLEEQLKQQHAARQIAGARETRQVRNSSFAINLGFKVRVMGIELQRSGKGFGSFLGYLDEAVEMLPSLRGPVASDREKRNIGPGQYAPLPDEYILLIHPGPPKDIHSAL